jgi:hypothetical protein
VQRAPKLDKNNRFEIDLRDVLREGRVRRAKRSDFADLLRKNGAWELKFLILYFSILTKLLRKNLRAGTAYRACSA